MPAQIVMDRRTLLGGASAAALAGLLGPAKAAEPLPSLTVTKDPNCACCTGWAAHMRRAGFVVAVVESADLQALKSRLGVPENLAACHTAEIAGYVIEGHVPAGAVRRLLAERPAARGLAVPGMPAGSPGMEMPGADERYEVVLFGPGGQQRSFGRYQGAEPI